MERRDIIRGSTMLNQWGTVMLIFSLFEYWSKISKIAHTVWIIYIFFLMGIIAYTWLEEITENGNMKKKIKILFGNKKMVKKDWIALGLQSTVWGMALLVFLLSIWEVEVQKLFITSIFLVVFAMTIVSVLMLSYEPSKTNQD